MSALTVLLASFCGDSGGGGGGGGGVIWLFGEKDLFTSCFNGNQTVHLLFHLFVASCFIASGVLRKLT